MKKNSLIIAALCLAISNKVSATFVSLTATQDAVLAYDAGIASVATTNYGFVTYNSAWCQKSTQRGVEINRSLIDFNLSSIPATAIILSANLYLYGNGAVGSWPGHYQSYTSGNDSYVERVTASWAEGTVTWNTQPGSTSVNSGFLSGTTVTNQNYVTNITALVQDWVNNPSTSFGLKLYLANEAITNALIFGSKDNGNPDLQPRLEIEYTNTCYGSVSLIADYDAAIGYHDGANTAGNNYGTAAQNAGFAVPSVAAPTGLNVNRALLHFDLSSLPSGASITSADMDLFAYGPVGSWPGHYQSTTGGNDCVLESVTGAWTEMGVTWLSQPGSVPTTPPTNLAGTTNAVLDYTGISIPIGLAQSWYSTPSTNYGLMLKMVVENASNILIFCSEDHPTTTKHPRLNLQYTYDCGGGGDGTGGDGKGGKFAAPSSFSKVATINEFFNVFPNPSKGNFNLKYSLIDRTSGSVVISDLQGRVIKEQTLDIQSNTFEVKDIPKGIYLCSLFTDGKLHSVEKIVVTE